MSPPQEDDAAIRARLLEERDALDATEASSRDAHRPLALDPAAPLCGACARRVESRGR